MLDITVDIPILNILVLPPNIIYIVSICTCTWKYVYHSTVFSKENSVAALCHWPVM